MELPTLTGPRVTLRPLAEGDIPTLLEIAAAPRVKRWWPTVDEGDLREQLGPAAETPALTIDLEGVVVGLIQCWEEADPEFRHAGMDLFVAEGWQGQGLGPEALRLLAGWLIRERGHHRLTIDPAAANDAAIRAYEKVGFKRVGVLREYERDPRTGAWRDGLLMDLLASDLVADDS